MAGPSHVGLTTFQPQEVIYDDQTLDVQWNGPNVKDLISLVEINWNTFYDKTVKKKQLWKKISEEMRANGHACLADDCDKKWRNLKKSFVAVLRKQTQGDFTHKFPHFDQIYRFLGKEIDPLGLREQGLKRKKTAEISVKERPITRIPYVEITADGEFDWDEANVLCLLDIILYHSESFQNTKEIDFVWESICNKMKENGHHLSNEQCQRKWNNLSEGFRHFHAEGEHTGILPDWPFYQPVNMVLMTMNVPVTLGPEEMNGLFPSLKGSIRPPVMNVEVRKSNSSAIQFAEDEMIFSSDKSALANALSKLESCLKVEEKLKRIEDKSKIVAKRKKGLQETNALLGSILTQIRLINANLERNKTGAESISKDPQEMMEGVVSFGTTPIINEETLFSMTAKLMKQEIESNEEEPEGIIYVQGS